MAKNLSAAKRTQIGARNYLRNKNYKSTIRTMLKKILAELSTYTSEDSFKDYQINISISRFHSKLDKAVKRGVIHKNSAARKKSALAFKLKALSFGL